MKRMIIVLILLIGFSSTGISAIPRIISYQGKLLGADEQPVPEGNYKLTFNLYNDSNTLLWTETHNQVFIGGGLFEVLLGTVTPFSIAFDQPYFLGIQVGADPELQPRMLLTSAAYAIRAEDADKLLGISMSPTPEPNKLLPLDNSGKFPASVLPGASGSDAYLKKGAPDTSRGNSASPMLLVSNLGAGDGLDGRSFDGVGVSGRSASQHGVTGWTDASGKSAVFGNSSAGIGLLGRSDANDGVVGWTGGSDKSGVFGHSNNIGVCGQGDAAGSMGVYAKHVTSGNFAKIATDDYGIHVGGLSRFDLPTGQIHISTPGGNPGLITYADNGHRRDIVFDNVGMRLLTSSSSSPASKGIDIDEQGNVSVTGMVTCASLKLTGGSDIAEPFNVKTPTLVKPGMVMAIDPQNPGKLKISDQAYDHCVAGVISGAGGIEPGMVMSQSGSAADGEYPVALTGRVYCWANAAAGAIEAGDLLTTSDTPGCAMKVADFDRAQGAILGKAMTALNQGQGLVLILVTLQ